MENEKELKIKAFCEHFKCSEEDIIILANNDVEFNDATYVIYTDSEAEVAERECLEEQLDEILRYSDVPEWVKKYFKREEWVEDNMNLERGSNLSWYDNIEIEVILENENGLLEYIYIYRID